MEFYRVKHAAASRMVRAAIDIVMVSELIGHGDLKQTLRYCHSSLETKQEAVGKLSRIYLPSLQPADEPLDNPMTGEWPRLIESIN